MIKNNFLILYFIIFFISVTSCSKEEFATSPRTISFKTNPVKKFDQFFCAQPTEISPKVDILYLVDNSGSSQFFPTEVKDSIKTIIDNISKEFDYRIISTGLLPVDDSTPYDDYYVLTNSNDPLSTEAYNKKIISSSELTFFSKKYYAPERGLNHAINFITTNVDNKSGLFRQGSNLIVVLFSNGRDEEIEYTNTWGGLRTNTDLYNTRLSQFKTIKNNLLKSAQLRLISTTAYKDKCDKNESYFSSLNSYVKMSQDLYTYSGAKDSPEAKDSYDICKGIINVFDPLNASIRKVIVQNKYRYWPLTFAKDTDVRNSFGDISVYKFNEGRFELMEENSSWTYYEHKLSTPLNLREPSSAGGEYKGKHFIKFKDGFLITSPACVQIKSSSRKEYFGYVLLNSKPKLETLVLKINGRTILPNKGWNYAGYIHEKNIKVAYPKPGDELPAIIKSGHMLQLNGVEDYYTSADIVEVSFTPDAAD